MHTREHNTRRSYMPVGNFTTVQLYSGYGRTVVNEYLTAYPRSPSASPFSR